MISKYKEYYLENKVKSLTPVQVAIAKKLGVPIKRWTPKFKVATESKKWCKRNKWFGVDKDRTQYAFIIHDKLVDAFVSYYNEVRKLQLTKEQIKLAKKIGIPITRLK